MRRVSLLLLLLLLVALPASADNCSSPGDCEETAGYLGAVGWVMGILGTLAGLLGTRLGMPFPGMSGLTGTSAPPTPPPDPNVVINPWTGQPLTQWQPGMPPDSRGFGEPGMVWINNQWLSPEDARGFINSSLTMDQRREQEAQQFVEHSQASALQHIKDRHDTLDQERKDEIRQRELEAELANIARIADRTGHDKVWKHAVGTGMYRPDGTIDATYVDRLREALRNDLSRDRVDTSFQSPFTDFANNTWDDVRHNAGVRIVAGMSSGAFSEFAYQGQMAWERMQRSFNEATNKGQEWGYRNAFGTGYGGFVTDNLPINTVKLLGEKGRNVGPLELLGSVGTDIFTAVGIAQTARSLSNSLNTFRGGGSWGDVLRSTAPPPIKIHPDKLPPGSRVSPTDYGMPPRNAMQIQEVANRHGINIQVRPTNPDARKWLEMGYPPKSMRIKSKSLGPLDVELGADPKNVGLVGYFKPKVPDLSKFPLEKAEQILERYHQRRKEFNNLKGDMAVLENAGDITVKNGVVYQGGTNKPFTGDHDLFAIPDKRGNILPANHPTVENVVNELKGPPFNAQHGAHVNWQYNPLDPSHGPGYRGVDQAIRGEHAPIGAGGGGKSLIQFNSYGKPTSAYNQGEIDRWGLPPSGGGH